MIKIAICDDDNRFIKKMEDMLKQYQWKEEYSIHTYLTTVALIENIYTQYDILIMDIYFGKGSLTKGTDVAAAIKEKYPDMLIIYVSLYSCYYGDIVQSEPFKFLEKPIDEENLYNVLDEAYKRIKSYKAEYTYIFKGYTHIVNLKEVLYFCSEHRKIYIRNKNGEEVFYYAKLDDVEREVNSICLSFIRISKSYLINIYNVQKIKNNSVIIADKEITVTRKYRETFSKKSFDYFR